MTCIAGLVHEGNVYIGADSAATRGNHLIIEAMSKVFYVDDFLIGCEQSVRMSQLLQYQLSVKKQDDECDYTYMITVFAEAVRDLLRNYGCSNIDENIESCWYSLIGYKGHLYQMNSDFSIMESANGIAALGSGMDYALGALAANWNKDPGCRILEALEVSARFCTTVSGPFSVEVL